MPERIQDVWLAFAFCHVVTVVSDRSRAKTGYQTCRIHLLLTYFGQLVATSHLSGLEWTSHTLEVVIVALV